jgi:sulfite reductase (NADPH) flavoprotein alpha-component
MKRLPGLRQAWFQLHWFLGITAGTVLIVIGLSGALLSFREEIVDLVTPGGRHVPVAGAPLAAPALAEALAQRHRQRQIGTLTLFAEPGHAARVIFAPPPGQRRGETLWVNPYDAASLPPLRAEPFFAWVESLHRWLLLPREDGRVVAGLLAGALLVLSISGLYLRWPRSALSWRAWFTFDTSARGRSFLWGLHSVAGTFAMVVYLGFTTTGLYWAYDWIRDPVDRAAGDPRPPRMQAGPKADRPAPQGPPADIAQAWAVFDRQARAAGGWQEVSLRMPTPGAATVLFTWLGTDAAHERARNRLAVKTDGSAITQDDPYAARTAGKQALTVIYPLHMGSYFGLPGRIAAMLAALMLPVFAVTGWMLYLDRRRKKREIARQQAALSAAVPSTLAGASPGGSQDPVLVAFATQSGTAQGLALRTAAMLRSAGVAVTVLPFADIQTERLQHFRRLLLVASTFGEGEAPDSARRAARALAGLPAPSLHHLQYGLLALGDRHYEKFCGFGHTLDHALEAAGATRLFPMVEVDDNDPLAIEHWRIAVGFLGGGPTNPGAHDFLGGAAEPLRPWRLAARECVNPGSQGAPLYRIDLLPPPGFEPRWLAGALVEMLPGRAGPQVDKAATAPRRYSIASLPAEGLVRLFVRQARHDGGLGLASGWLTVDAPPGGDIHLRLLENPAFAPCGDDCPAVFIGNGSGWAGLRAHLLARFAAGRHRNWLLFGERQRACDGFFLDETSAWQAAGKLETVDLVFSRDQPGRRHVQDRLRESAPELRQWLEAGACVHVCGSLEGMAAGVDAALADILGQDGLDDLVASGRYRRDVY